MLVMPAPSGMPSTVWETAETAEMRDILPLYGKTYHFWQVDRGDPVPLGAPMLMGSFTTDEDVKRVHEGGLEGLCKDRDGRFGVDVKHKREVRKGIERPEGWVVDSGEFSFSFSFLFWVCGCGGCVRLWLTLRF